jgi:hypothetical protein
LLVLDIQCQRLENYLVYFNVLEYYNSACVVTTGTALQVVNNGGITAKASTVLVKSLCGIKEGGVDTNGTIFWCRITNKCPR